MLLAQACAATSPEFIWRLLSKKSRSSSAEAPPILLAVKELLPVMISIAFDVAVVYSWSALIAGTTVELRSVTTPRPADQVSATMPASGSWVTSGNEVASPNGLSAVLHGQLSSPTRRSLGVDGPNIVSIKTRYLRGSAATRRNYSS